ncbi:hypothetical protein PJ985_20875 [Streptomyces sp. ACA25]|uniref:hypothetical protein n=1 Tax=Streptomyces sp. ACA25 TaxID=3022596 RepID=UPI0023078F70|nr:hypothetical protein [Streptomyces sp. ACA25]MDB1090017.1 hypothetical protein [Streptomyces sp. ACA25]
MARTLTMLDGLGSVQFGPEGLGFDGEEIPWEKVRGVRMHDGADLLTSLAVEYEFERMGQVLPPVPGRAWVLRKAGSALTALIRLVRTRMTDRPADRHDIIWEITYTGRFGREKTLNACLYTTVFLMLRPDVAAALLATAHAHGIPVAEVERRSVEDADQPEPAERSAQLDELCRQSEQAAAALSGDGVRPESCGAEPSPGEGFSENPAAERTHG